MKESRNETQRKAKQIIEDVNEDEYEVFEPLLEGLRRDD